MSAKIQNGFHPRHYSDYWGRKEIPILIGYQSIGMDIDWNYILRYRVYLLIFTFANEKFSTSTNHSFRDFATGFFLSIKDYWKSARVTNNGILAIRN